MSLTKVVAVAVLVLVAATSLLAGVRPALAYTPRTGDYFNYSETTTVNNGSGSYDGYNDQSLVTGMEQVNSVNGSVVTSSFKYSFQYSNNQGNSSSSSSSGSYTWSSSSFTYINGTDNQVGYSTPTYVWFAMNPSIPVGSTFYILNTQFTVLSKNFTYQLPSQNNAYVQTIKAEGTGEHQRDDSYGVFTATYTWDAYFDPSTGYIVGYTYVEQDNGQYQGQPGSFTYADDLYETGSSYTLTPASPPPPPSLLSSVASGLAPYAGYIIVGFILVLLVVPFVISRRRRRERLPQHAPYAPPSSPPTPWQSNVDLGAKPSEQVVIREVAKVNCKYCGTLIPTTVDRCPYCGGPRQ